MYFIVRHSLPLLLLLFCIDTFIYASQFNHCSVGLYSCSQSTRCISQSYVCDGEHDCLDGSDESNCTVDPCLGRYSCQGGGKCIDKSLLCDSFKDCPHGDDESEQQCSPPTSCDQTTHFRCRFRTNQCISKLFLCNGELDCQDGSDESVDECHGVNGTMTSVKCKANYFQCLSRDLCIPMEYKCDHKLDCLDGSDEKDCLESLEVSSCSSSNATFKCSNTDQCIERSSVCNNRVDCFDSSDEHATLCHTIENLSSLTKSSSVCAISTDFYCGANDSNMCIDSSWVCDGSRDCVNGMDEIACTSKSCADHEFQCSSGFQCVSNALLCNGHADCPDKSDEFNCETKKTSTAPQCDPVKEFDCTNNGRLCIPLAKVCNKRNDCGGLGEDEQPGGSAKNCNRNLCKKNGNCSHVCVNRYADRVCLCPPGYRLVDDGRTCVDVDECREQGDDDKVCSQICLNTKGSYRCECLPGYVRNSSHTSQCLAPGEKLLVYATGDSIRQIQLLRREMNTIMDKGLLSVAMTFDMHSEPSPLMFYVNVLSGTIEMLSLTDATMTQKSVILFSETNSLIEGVAYDWILGLLFWTDEAHGAIYGMNVTSRQRFTLVNSNLEKPRAILVEPGAGRVYWTDWGQTPRIERIHMDGSAREVIVEKTIRQPNGLALDFTTGRLYWTDSKVHSVYSYDPLSREIKVIVQHENFFPFDVDVFEDRVYWSDWLTESITSANKFSGRDLQLHVHCRKPMGVRIAHKLRQPKSWPNRCLHHTCSHICLPVAGTTQNGSSYVCTCPMDGDWKLGADQRTCYQDTLLNGTHSPTAINMFHHTTETNTIARGKIAFFTTSAMLSCMLLVTLMGYVLYTKISPRKTYVVHFENGTYRPPSTPSSMRRGSVGSSNLSIHNIPRCSSQQTMNSQLVGDVNTHFRPPSFAGVAPPVDWGADETHRVIPTYNINAQAGDEQRLLDDRAINEDILV